MTAQTRTGTASAYPTPAMRRLRIYAFDPQASIELDTAVINDAVIELPWETPWEDPLEIGPVNEYLEVIDYDPACDLFYAPVDLNDPLLLAQNGLPPAEGRPQFHQQMVFAVAMKTIRIFERALGRPIMWARAQPRNTTPEYWKQSDAAFVKRLRIYPHALREANAYYSPDKTALLFGYFKKDGGDTQDDGWVFTCLSQDIVAHETTHAILHGMQKRSIEPSSVDALAFHEAFSDIVALFQHFAMTNVVEHQLKGSRGSLRNRNLLTGLASQFGHATGQRGALRYALQMIGDETNKGPSGAVHKLSDTTEPHDRGQFLVAAVFDAFVTIYERRSADLIRLAGESVRAGGDLSPDLVGRLATEARKAAEHILRMCVRALDYVPPVDIQFGEYLRAIITADADLVPDDPMRYRVAIAEAFRKRGIFVPGAISMAPDSLMWDEPDINELPSFAEKDEMNSLFADILRQLELSVNFGREPDASCTTGYERHSHTLRRNLRAESMRIISANQLKFWNWLFSEDEGGAPEEARHEIDWQTMLGIKLAWRLEYEENGERKISEAPRTVAKSDRNGRPSVDVNSVRVARRQGPDGQELHQLIAQVIQKRRGYFDPDFQRRADAGEIDEDDPQWKEPDFWFRGGATVLIDLRDGRVRRVIRKRIDNNERLAKERLYRGGGEGALGFARREAELPREPFAFIHRGQA